MCLFRQFCLGIFSWISANSEGPSSSPSSFVWRHLFVEVVLFWFRSICCLTRSWIRLSTSKLPSCFEWPRWTLHPLMSRRKFERFCKSVASLHNLGAISDSFFRSFCPVQLSPFLKGSLNLPRVAQIVLATTASTHRSLWLCLHQFQYWCDPQPQEILLLYFINRYTSFAPHNTIFVVWKSKNL